MQRRGALFSVPGGGGGKMAAGDLGELLVPHMPTIRVPRSGDRVYKNECAFSYDSPVRKIHGAVAQPAWETGWRAGQETDELWARDFFSSPCFSSCFGSPAPSERPPGWSKTGSSGPFGPLACGQAARAPVVSILPKAPASRKASKD